MTRGASPRVKEKRHVLSLEESFMKYGAVSCIGRPVSRLVFGTATPTLFAAFRSVYGNAPDFSQRLNAAFELLDTMYALGVNTFDCASNYGEEPLGEWLEARDLFDKITVLTKGAHPNLWRKRVTDYDILSDANDSLKKLRTRFIDLYLLHRDDPNVPVGPIVEVLNKLHDEGKVGAFGVSNWTTERIEEADEYALRHHLIPFAVSSPNFGLADQMGDPWGGGCVSISGPKNKAARAWYAARNMPIFAYSTMARGFFSGQFRSDSPEDAKRVLDAPGCRGYFFPENIERLRRCEQLAAQKRSSVPQIAMAWLFNQSELNLYALTSPVNRDQMEANIQASELHLTSEECQWLNLET